MPAKSLFKTTITRQLNKNEFGNIYLARIATPDGQNHQVVIERVMKIAGPDRQPLTSYIDANRAVKNLTHPAIARVFDIYEEDDFAVLVSEYTDGRNVAQILAQASKKKSPLAVVNALHIAAQVAEALDHAHRCTDQVTGMPSPIVHGQVAAENVIVGLDGRVRLGGFGKPRPALKTTAEKNHLKPVADGRDDILALGILTWELLTGKKISSPRISIRELNPEVDKDLEMMVLRLLAPSPEARYQNASDVAADFTHYIKTQDATFTEQKMADDVTRLFIDEFGKGPAQSNPFAGIGLDGQAQVQARVRSRVPEVSENTPKKKSQNQVSRMPRINFGAIRRAATVSATLGAAVFVYLGLRGQLPSQLAPVQAFVNNTVEKLSFDKPVQKDEQLANAKARAEQDARREVASLEAAAGMTTAEPSPAQEKEADEPYKPSQIVTYENKIFKVDSVPQGASVFVDGKYIARTPAQFIVPEKHRLHIDVTLKGYEDHEEDLVPYKYNHEMKIELTKKTAGAGH